MHRWSEVSSDKIHYLTLFFNDQSATATVGLRTFNPVNRQRSQFTLTIT